ncbi:hypothetical protein D3C86_1653760 [compost metagenome]
MVELADHQQHPGRLAAAEQLPLHVEAAGHVPQVLAQGTDIAGHASVEAEHRAHEKLPGELVVELRQFADVALLPGQACGDRGDDAGRCRAVDLEDVMFVGGVH